jgi:cellulose synthase (UDP-forming)
VPLLDRRHRLALALSTALWLAAAVTFADWWLTRAQPEAAVGYVVTTVSLFTFVFLFPGWFFFYVNRARRPASDLRAPPDLRVAMVVTKTPSEPWPLVRTTLEAMLDQDHPGPYEVWLADEDPQQESLDWCASHGVGVASRRGHPDYQRDTWPRRRRSKEGNLAYFYDTIGYDRFDVVCQFDADHVPDRTYLRHMLVPFGDPRVGYVGAPSICDRNATTSWAARGRLHEEAALHGAIQAGANVDFAPSAIGSHYAVRTAALREIGGLGPELAEDFSTTLLMNAGGWDGAFAVDAIAHGLGPANVADCITQELQWSRSMMTLLITIGPRAWLRLSLGPKLRLGFCLLWYPLASTLALLGSLLPLWALLRHGPLASVGLGGFLVHIVALDASVLTAILVLRHAGSLRPRYAPPISWEMILFRVVRWPWMAVGCALAVVGRLSRRPLEWKVTPKGHDAARDGLPARVLMPLLLLVAALVLPVLLLPNPEAAGGYLFLSLASALTYAAAAIVIMCLDFRERMVPGGSPGARPWRPQASWLVGAAIVALVATGVALEGPSAVQSISAPEVRVARLGSPNLGVAVGGLSQNEATPWSRAQLGDALTFERAVDLRAGIVMWFSDWRQPPPRRDRLEAITARGSIPEITWEPWDHRLGPYTPQRRFGLGRILRGDYDAYVSSWARRLAAHDGPVLLRFAHEMNHGAYPWGRVAGNTPQEFIAVWRRLHGLFRRAGADNVRWVWSPMASRLNFDYYPGDDVVDMLSLTGFNGGSELDWSGWRTPTQIFEDAIRRLEKRIPGKRIELGELSTVAAGGDRAAWVTDLFRLVRRHPSVDAVVWFNLEKEADWRLEPGTSESQAFAESAPRWLAGGERRH